MAKVILIIDDEGDEDISVSLESDPPLGTQEDAEYTNAQLAGLVALKTIVSIGDGDA